MWNINSSFASLLHPLKEFMFNNKRRKKKSQATSKSGFTKKEQDTDAELDTIFTFMKQKSEKDNCGQRKKTIQYFNAKNLSKGEAQITQFLKKETYYIDRSKFFFELMADQNQLMMLQQPSGSGKTTLLRMIENFFKLNIDENCKEIVNAETLQFFKESELAVSSNQDFISEHLGKHPCLFIDMSKINIGETITETKKQIWNQLFEQIQKYRFVFQNSQFSQAFYKQNELIQKTDAYNSQNIIFHNSIKSLLSSFIQIMFNKYRKQILIVFDNIQAVQMQYFIRDKIAAQVNMTQFVTEILNFKTQGQNENQLNSKIILTSSYDNISKGLKQKMKVNKIDSNCAKYFQFFGINESQLTKMIKCTYQNSQTKINEILQITDKFYGGIFVKEQGNKLQTRMKIKSVIEYLNECKKKNQVVQGILYKMDKLDFEVLKKVVLKQIRTSNHSVIKNLQLIQVSETKDYFSLKDNPLKFPISQGNQMSFLDCYLNGEERQRSFHKQQCQLLQQLITLTFLNAGLISGVYKSNGTFVGYVPNDESRSVIDMLIGDWLKQNKICQQCTFFDITSLQQTVNALQQCANNNTSGSGNSNQDVMHIYAGMRYLGIPIKTHKQIIQKQTTNGRYDAAYYPNSTLSDTVLVHQYKYCSQKQTEQKVQDGFIQIYKKNYCEVMNYNKQNIENIKNVIVRALAFYEKGNKIKIRSKERKHTKQQVQVILQFFGDERITEINQKQFVQLIVEKFGEFEIFIDKICECKSKQEIQKLIKVVLRMKQDIQRKTNFNYYLFLKNQKQVKKFYSYLFDNNEIFQMDWLFNLQIQTIEEYTKNIYTDENDAKKEAVQIMRKIARAERDPIYKQNNKKNINKVEEAPHQSKNRSRTNATQNDEDYQEISAASNPRKRTKFDPKIETNSQTRSKTNKK